MFVILTVFFYLYAGFSFSFLNSADNVLIDCMLSLGMITINALAADSVVIPTQPHYLSAKGLEMLLRSVSMVKRQINLKLRIDGILSLFEFAQFIVPYRRRQDWSVVYTQLAIFFGDCIPPNSRKRLARQGSGHIRRPFDMRSVFRLYCWYGKRLWLSRHTIYFHIFALSYSTI